MVGAHSAHLLSLTSHDLLDSLTAIERRGGSSLDASKVDGLCACGRVAGRTGTLLLHHEAFLLAHVLNLVVAEHLLALLLALSLFRSSVERSR